MMQEAQDASQLNEVENVTGLGMVALTGLVTRVAIQLILDLPI